MTKKRRALVTRMPFAMRLSSMLPAVLFLGWFTRLVGPPGKRHLLVKFPPEILTSQYWDPS